MHGGGGGGFAGCNTNQKPIYGDDAPFDPAPWLDLAANGRHDGKSILLWGADHYKTRLPEGGRFLCWDKSCGQGATANFVDAEYAWMNRRNARCIYRQSSCPTPRCPRLECSRPASQRDHEIHQHVGRAAEDTHHPQLAYPLQPNPCLLYTSRCV